VFERKPSSLSRGPRVRIQLPPAASRVRTRFLDHGWRRRARIQRGCAGFQLDRAGAVRVARFVCSDSSAASASGGTSGSNAPTLSCCSGDPRDVRPTRLGSYGGNGLLPTEYGRARSPRSGAPLFPRNPKAGPSFPCAWAFGDRRWRGRRQVAIGPPGLFGLVRRSVERDQACRCLGGAATRPHRSLFLGRTMKAASAQG
jgi:hypothetical protein